MNDINQRIEKLRELEADPYSVKPLDLIPAFADAMQVITELQKQVSELKDKATQDIFYAGKLDDECKELERKLAVAIDGFNAIKKHQELVGGDLGKLGITHFMAAQFLEQIETKDNKGDSDDK